MNEGLDRFVKAQENMYMVALQEIKNGRKISHWMWYIFPQISGLGSSAMSVKYSIQDLEEARSFLAHPVLGPRLIAITTALLELPVKKANHIFGSPDDMKLKSSMTLFNAVSSGNPVFKKVIDEYFHGATDRKTEQLIS